MMETKLFNSHKTTKQKIQKRVEKTNLRKKYWRRLVRKV